MADNVLMAYHIVHDPDERAKHVLNTKKLYKWRITEQTKGTPVIGYVATWAKDKAVIHSALSEIQQVSNKVIALSDGLTKQLGLQEAQKDPEHDLKKRSAKELNKAYQGLQQQIKQATDPQQKSELKNQLNAVHQEISNRTQKQLQDFVKQTPKNTQPRQDETQQIRR
ncbi:LtrC-like protein [Lactiplantibacillus plantarum]|nr:DUF5839 family protein [Lactiplantibacillus plantarum]KZU32000.1 LtrC-like protein [Lactiplantibacillus plantarum]KZU75848.1 LtrC-like protein [Lactiplantibacillus plantarum]